MGIFSSADVSILSPSEESFKSKSKSAGKSSDSGNSPLSFEFSFAGVSAAFDSEGVSSD